MRYVQGFLCLQHPKVKMTGWQGNTEANLPINTAVQRLRELLMVSKFLAFYGTRNLVPCEQITTTGPYPKPA
jgi:hemolysin activation/secretion protein